MAIIEYATYAEPDVVVSKSGKLIAVKDPKDAKLFFVRNLRQNYLSRIWRENMQFKKISKKQLRQYCGKDFCYFKSHQLYILFNKNGLKYMDGIKQQQIACINLSGEQIDGRRKFRFYLGQSDLAAKGAHKIWLADDNIRIEYARSKLIK